MFLYGFFDPVWVTKGQNAMALIFVVVTCSKVDESSYYVKTISSRKLSRVVFVSVFHSLSQIVSINSLKTLIADLGLKISHNLSMKCTLN